MKKADYKFNKNKQKEIQDLYKQNEPFIWLFNSASNKPIFTPKRKKKK